MVPQDLRDSPVRILAAMLKRASGAGKSLRVQHEIHLGFAACARPIHAFERMRCRRCCFRNQEFFQLAVCALVFSYQTYDDGLGGAASDLRRIQQRECSTNLPGSFDHKISEDAERLRVGT